MCFFKKRKEKKAQEAAAKQQSINEKKKVQDTAPKKDEPVKNEVKKQEVNKSKETVTETKKTAPATVKYHVSQNKDSKSEFHKQWRVRKSGSDKVIKYFPTQAEAIAYANELAKNNDTSVVIHKVDGSIRKQDYSKE